MRVFHLRCVFRGRVQGVGFRVQTLDVARGFDVSGYVRNEPDASVMLEVEGVEAEVKAFHQEVCVELAPYIRSQDLSTGEREAVFSGFRIT